METLSVDVDWGQSQGTRKSQQDHAAIVSWPNGFSLSILADGMGGHAGGAEASHLVVESFRSSFVEDQEPDIRQRFLKGLSTANLNVYEYTKQHPELAGMGSTFLAVVFDGDSIQWISVGDSPLWLYREGKIRQLNENHSMASVLAKKVEEGLMSAEDAATSPERSQLLEAILGEDIKMVDAPTESFPVKAGDIILLASDGVETCSLDEIESLLSSSAHDSTTIVEGILTQVKKHQRKSQDNSTINVMRVLEDQAEIDTVNNA